MAINKATLMGFVGGDPEIRSTQDGREIANFSLATTESWKDKNTGERKDKTEWHRIVIFSQGLVNVVRDYVKKGSRVYLEGQLVTRKWQDRQGVDHYTTEIVLQKFNSTLQLIGGSNDNKASQERGDDKKPFNAKEHVANAKKKFESKESEEQEFVDDEIPF